MSNIINTQNRIFFDLVTLVLIFLVPWWFSIILAIAGIFLFSNFYESLIFAILLDGFYGVPDVAFFGFNSMFTFWIGAVFIISLFLKTRLRFYAR